MKEIIHLSTVLACALALAGCSDPSSTASAQTSERTQQDSPRHGGQSALPDDLDAAQIARVLHLINAGEIQEAQLAEQRATSSDVQQFAQRMIREHSQAQRDLQARTRECNIQPASNAFTRQLEREEQQRMQRFRQLQGREFDRAYTDAQVQEHRTGVTLLDRNIPNIDDARFRRFVESQRTMIDNHLQHALRVQEGLQPRASR